MDRPDGAGAQTRYLKNYKKVKKCLEIKEHVENSSVFNDLQ